MRIMNMKMIKAVTEHKYEVAVWRTGDTEVKLVYISIMQAKKLNLNAASCDVIEVYAYCNGEYEVA